MIQFCKNCRYYRPALHHQTEQQQADYAKCAHPNVASLVDGRGVEYCDIVREFKGCGKAGKWFEPLGPSTYSPPAAVPYWRSILNIILGRS